MPDQYVLLSQFSLWNEVLNDGFIVDSSGEYDRMQAACAEWSTNEQQRRRQQSWLQIFNLEYGSEGYWGPLDEREIQACVECVAAADVVAIEPFTAR